MIVGLQKDYRTALLASLVPVAMLFGVVDRGRIVEDFQNYAVLFLVPIILPLNLLPGLQWIVEGFKIALG